MSSLWTKIKTKNWIKENVLRVEVIGPAIIIFLAIVFFLTHERKKYDYEGIPENAKIKETKKKKIKKKKRVWKHEEKCRQILEKIFGKKFPSCRPDFLKNPITGKNLEIDCYNEELKLGLEYNGIQHSKYTENFHRKGGIQEFEYQVKRDTYKMKKCKLNGVDIVVVPHYISSLDLESFIVKELKRMKRLPRKIL